MPESKQPTKNIIGVVVTALLDATSLAGLIAGRGSVWFVAVTNVAFVITLLLLVKNQNERIGELEESLENRQRRREIRRRLGTFSERLRALSESGDLPAAYAITSEIETYCESTDELSGYWAKINAGALFSGRPAPSYLSPLKYSAWYYCQARVFNLGNLIDTFKD